MDIVTKSLQAYIGGRMALPPWLPRNGLLYYDSFDDYNPCSYMGHRYRKISGTPAIYCGAVLGERALCKDEVSNQLQFDIPAGATGRDLTFGAWVCDYGQTGDNLQFFNLKAGQKTCYLSLKNAKKRTLLSVWDSSTSSSLASAYGATLDSGVEWHFVYAWVGSGWFGIRADNRQDGENLYTENHYGHAKWLEIEYAYLLSPLIKGVAIRHAFLYNRVITVAEGRAIRDGSMPTAGRPAWADN